jgi:hypothetical protein
VPNQNGTFENTTVILRKIHGEVFENIRAYIVEDSIEIWRNDLAFEIGDNIINFLPDGEIVSYTVLEVEFIEALGSIPDSYQLKVRDMHGTLDTTRDDEIAENEKALFLNLKQAILRGVENQQRREEILLAIENMEESTWSSNYVYSYIDFIETLGDFTTLVGAFLPALSRMLIL